MESSERQLPRKHWNGLKKVCPKKYGEPKFPSKATVAFRLPSLSLLLIENRETDDAGMHRNRNGGRDSKCNNTIQ